jgi:hypothetical protein
MSVEWEVDAERFLIAQPASDAERLIRLVEQFDARRIGFVRVVDTFSFFTSMTSLSSSFLNRRSHVSSA